MAQDRMTPEMAWEGYVGSQTPEEFVERYREEGTTDIDEMCTTYSKDIPRMFGNISGLDLAEVAELLAEYIREQGIS